MTVLDQKETSSFVRRRIVRDWREDIKVFDVTTRRRRLIGKKQTVVEIGCRSPIACEQARLSLAGFVENDRRDWEVSHWRVIKGDDLPFRIELIDPRPDLSEE
jgi:hypothetical protein